jgi:hypothetical protein
MDENDFDQILHTDFHPNTAPPPTEIQHDHEQQQHHQQPDHDQETQIEQNTLQLDSPHDERGISRESDAYNFANEIEESRPIDRQRSLGDFGRSDNDDRELTFEDKKQRQREQNKFAALKSRAKKRDK